jgi:hypothetical protein
VIESLHFIPNQVCSLNSTELSVVPASLRACLEQLAAVENIAQAIAPTFAISPDAEAYAQSLKNFLWSGLTPALVGIWGMFSIPKILKGILHGLIPIS